MKILIIPGHNYKKNRCRQKIRVFSVKPHTHTHNSCLVFLIDGTNCLFFLIKTYSYPRTSIICIRNWNNGSNFSSLFRQNSIMFAILLSIKWRLILSFRTSRVISIYPFAPWHETWWWSHILYIEYILYIMYVYIFCLRLNSWLQTNVFVIVRLCRCLVPRYI